MAARGSGGRGRDSRGLHYTNSTGEVQFRPLLVVAACCLELSRVGDRGRGGGGGKGGSSSAVASHVEGVAENSHSVSHKLRHVVARGGAPARFLFMYGLSTAHSNN